MGHSLRMTPERYDELRARRTPAPPVAIVATTASKFGNEKTNGFDSKREARRHAELDLLQKAGQISDLKCQVTFELIPRQTRDNGSKENPVSYRADFTYIEGGKLVVEDAKGHRTQDYIIKRKLMLLIHQITIKEV